MPKQRTTPVPPGEIPTAYTLRNFWQSHLNRVRIITALYNQDFPTMETTFNAAMSKGLDALESELELQSTGTTGATIPKLKTLR